MKIQDIVANPKQPRKDFDPEKLQELADNIKAVGLKQPLIVRPFKDGKFQLVDGERRFRACKLIDLKDVPVEVREDIKTEQDAAIQSYIMNEQRLNYSPQDKEAYIHHLKETTGLSTRKLAVKLGVHHSHIDHLLEAYRFRQKLPPTMVGTLQLTHSALRETAMIKDDKLRIRFLKMISDGNLKQSAVRDVYKILQKIPPEREEVFEAYAQGMLTSTQIQFLLEGAPLGRDILLSPEKEDARFFTGSIPPKIKDRLLYLVSESDEEKSEILSEARRYNKSIRDLILARPKEDPDELRAFHKLQIYDFPEEIHNFYQTYSIEAIEREFNREDDFHKRYIWRAIQWWISVYYEYREKVRQVEPQELIIPVIDLVTEVLHWEAFKRSIDKDQEKHKEWEKGGVEWIEE
jgi:ParB family chromosome partitioning protein